MSIGNTHRVPYKEKTMSTFKEYAKRAKERMKNGFWENAQRSLQHEREVAATTGVSPRRVGEEHRRRIEQQIYDYDGYRAEEEFYAKVVEMLSGDELVINPIMRLADKQLLETLSPQDKQVYLSGVAARYRKAVEKYNSLHTN